MIYILISNDLGCKDKSTFSMRSNISVANVIYVKEFYRKLLIMEKQRSKKDLILDKWNEAFSKFKASCFELKEIAGNEYQLFIRTVDGRSISGEMKLEIKKS